ncbi:MAG: hypothetical protein PF508_21035, partial [Spirochaeta sp.]|nr:hypothetical protein [Spirochaeta sp.]
QRSEERYRQQGSYRSEARNDTGSKVRTAAKRGTIPTTILKHCETMVYGLLQLRKAFSLPFWSAGYNRNATISEGRWCLVVSFSPGGFIRDSNLG